jgi:aminoglycoside phosphotransferase (APT) family kinase protein
VSNRRLRHGYTNQTWAAGGSVVKRYLGPDGEQRMLQELAAIEAVASAVPTAKVLSVHWRERRVEFARVRGVPGQDLIEQGYANNVMKAAGRALAALHSHPEAQVTHGDYGPQNLLLDAAGEAVVLVADWEFSFAGRDPLTDLAWAEWIVRMHHPAAASSISGLFAGYGHTPPWDDRKRVMLRRCEWLRDRCASADNAHGEQLWAQRLALTQSWPGDSGDSV